MRVSNPRTVAYVRFKMPSESSELPGTEAAFPDDTFEGWPQETSTMAMRSLHPGQPVRACTARGRRGGQGKCARFRQVRMGTPRGHPPPPLRKVVQSFMDFNM